MCAGAHCEGPELRIFRSTKAARAFLQSLGLRRSVTSMRHPMVPQVISALLAFLFLSDAAQAHDIYTHLKSRSGKSCCDNSDCRPAPYRITSSGVEMLVGETWVWVPRGIIEYRMLEGDTGESNGGHWCGERYDGGFVTYCAFLPPTLAAAP